MTLDQYYDMGRSSQLTKTDMAILGFLIKNVVREYSIRMISESIDKAYPGVRENVLKLSKENVINVSKINPKQNLCSLNLKNIDNIPVFSYVEAMRRSDYFSIKKGMKTIVDDILNKIEGNSFTLMIFGSHVKKKEKPQSDIDILLLIPSTEDEKRVMSAVSSAERLTNRKLHSIVMTYNGFLDSLGDESSLPREVLENHIIAYGSEAFYRSLILWMRDSGKSLR